MTIAWLLYLLLVGALLCAGAAALSSAASALRGPTRGVWSAALAGIVLLGVIAPRERLLQVRYEPAGSIGAPSSSRATTPTRADGGVRDAWEALGRGSTSLIASLERRVPRAIEVPLLVAWAAASLLLVALFAAVNVRVARARRVWPLRLLHGVSARVTPATGPAVVGLAHPEIVVPRSLLDRSDDEQRLILSHEREHVRAGDHLLLAAGWLVVIALPWHPAVWYLLARLRLAIELDCDARVLRAGASPRSYGTLLIEVAAHAGGSRIGALALADGPSQLERRIRAMNGSRKRYGAASAAVACAIGAVMVLVACEAKIPTSAEIEQMDVASAQRSAAQGGFLRTPSGDRTDIFINGVPASVEAARALEARQIGSITLVKNEFSTGRDTMFVVTSDRLSHELDRAKSAKEPDPFEQVERSLARKVAPDTQHPVEHVLNERSRMRVRSESNPPTTLSRKAVPTRRGNEPQPTITIDGKIASEAQLAALDTRDIASIAVYKGKEGQLLMRSNDKENLEVTSGPPRGTSATVYDALIAVTTKMGRQAQTKRP
jgi:beta-lactamase regulating signal transducer with metallopeptidase domain